MAEEARREDRRGARSDHGLGPRKDVEEILDSLAAVGVLTVLEAEGGKRWRATVRAP